MNTNLVLWSALASIALGLFLLGWMSHALFRRRRYLVSPISVDGLAERADVNGSALVRIAREMRGVAADEGDGVVASELLRWAPLLEQAAVEHLECINAISLDAMQAVSETQPVHLGEFGSQSVDGRRRQPGPGPFAECLMRGGELHG